jgi:exodeoxyribonuclease V alpha subunit
MPKAEVEITFSGRLIRKIYDSPDFKVYAMQVDKNLYPYVKFNKYGNVSINGDMGDLLFDADYEVTAVHTMGKYGSCYKVKNIRREIFDSEADTKRFLYEILTANQAEVMFENYPDIVQRVREDRLDDIDLNKLKGIKEKTFEVIKRKIEENYVLSDFVVQFKGFFSFAMIKKLYNKYLSVNAVMTKLQNNPYKCLCGISGVGFKSADKLLLQIENESKKLIVKGEPPIIDFKEELITSKQRCLACIMFILNENENDGNTKLNIADLKTKFSSLAKECEPVFDEVIKNSKPIYYNPDKVEAALQHTYDNEKYIADTMLNAINSEQITWEFDVDKYKTINGTTISDEQLSALKNVCCHTISILNGPAGVGKTFTTKAIIKMLHDNNKSFMLMTPTGKSSKVLQVNSGEKSSTIHRGLGYSVTGNFYYQGHKVAPSEQYDYYSRFDYNLYSKIPYNIVVIDEFSMVDVSLFRCVVEAIDFSKTKLLLIGDNAQLCSVGCGNLLHDFMQSKIIPTVTLSKVFRYSDGGLMKVATDVRLCEDYFDKPLNKGMTFWGTNKDYGFVNTKDTVIVGQCVELYKQLLKQYEVEDLQVLTAMNKGECGVIEMNNKLQRVANSNYGSQVNIKYGDTVYYVGDLVIQIKNNYRAPIAEEYWTLNERLYYERNNEAPTAFVANGESGVIESIVDNNVIINFDNVHVKYNKSELNLINLGYAITVHKSQGDSIKIVILCTPNAHINMLNSNLLYVGLTRMRERCFHLGSKAVVEKAIRKKANLSRDTFMQELLLGLQHENQKKEEVKNNEKVSVINETENRHDEPEEIDTNAEVEIGLNVDVDEYLFG